jgi:anti-sigma B factor antagonist
MSDLATNSTVLPTARLDGDNLFAAVKGDVDLNNSPDLRVAILAILKDRSPKRLILNLSGVSYMDSSAIAVLVEALQKVRKAGGKICLTGLQPRVKGLLEIARLDQIFVLAKDDTEAASK